MTSVVTFLTPAEAARLLGVTPAAVRLMVNRGELSIAATTEGGIRLFRRSDVLRLAERRRATKGRTLDGEAEESGQ